MQEFGTPKSTFFCYKSNPLSLVQNAFLLTQKYDFLYENIGFSLVFEYIYRCAHLFIDAAIYKMDFLQFNLLSNGLIEKFWDALWLGIGPFFRFICKNSIS